MKKMTEAQAEFYIKAGYFPEPTDIAALVDLQDVFGHQRYWACIKWLYNFETSYNAEKLFRLIWDETAVESMLAQVRLMREDHKKLADLHQQLRDIEKQYVSLKSRIYRDKTNMEGDLDYYSDPDNIDNGNMKGWLNNEF